MASSETSVSRQGDLKMSASSDRSEHSFAGVLEINVKSQFCYADPISARGKNLQMMRVLSLIFLPLAGVVGFASHLMVRFFYF